MVNLLRSKTTAREIGEILAVSPLTSALPRLGDESWLGLAYHRIGGGWVRLLQAAAGKDLMGPMPELPPALYREFYLKGQRGRFENAYFERRRIVGRAALCALFDPAPERWLGPLFERVWEIASEFSWPLPATVNSPSGQDPMRLDLVAAETCALLADLVSIFSAVMPRALADRIRARARAEFFENYLHRHDDFWWTRSTNHWNAVCHFGLLASALALEDDMVRLAEMLETAAGYLPYYLEGFGSDGACREGPAYWQYGFGAFAELNRRLEAFTGGRLSLIEGDPLIGEIARYGFCVTLEGHQIVNFGDTPRIGSLNPALLSLLAARLDDPDLAAVARRNYAKLSRTGVSLQGPRSDFQHLVRLFLNLPAELPADAPLPLLSEYMRDVGVAVERFTTPDGRTVEFAVKAGNNAEHHNHNDCGSFLLHVDGVPIIPEIGQQEYGKDFFRENRYDYLAPRTLGHSLPVVNGQEQAAGTGYAAEVLARESSPEHFEMSVDISECYPAIASCGDLVRSFYINKLEGRIRVKEFYELGTEQSYETAIITEGEVEDRGTWWAIQDGPVVVHLHPFPDTEVQAIEELEYRDVTGQARQIKRIVLVPSHLGEQKFVGYEIEIRKVL